MAARYWVGGTGNWLDDTNHWATSSGGSGGGGNLPTATDDVFIDSNSGFGGGGTITLDSGLAACHDFTATSGHSYAISYANSDLYIYGSAVFEAGIDFNTGGTYLNFVSADIGETITTNGVVANYYLFGSSDGTSASASWTLQDDLTTILDAGVSLTFSNGTFDANDKKIITGNIAFDNSTATANPTLIMGNNTWELAGSVSLYASGGPGVITVNAESSTIKMVYSDAGDMFIINVNDNSFDGLIFNNLWIVAPNAPQMYFNNSMTWASITIDCTPNAIYFAENTTTTIGELTLTGNVSKTIAINSWVVGGGSPTQQHTFSKSSGTVICDYLDLSNSNAAGGATWYAGSHSVNTTNNTGWLFQDPPVDTGGIIQVSYIGGPASGLVVTKT